MVNALLIFFNELWDSVTLQTQCYWSPRRRRETENIFEGKNPTIFPGLMRTKCTDPSSVNPEQKNHEEIDTKAHQNQLAKNQ